MIELIQHQHIRPRSRNRRSLQQVIESVTLFVGGIAISPRRTALLVLTGGAFLSLAVTFSGLLPSFIRLYDEPLQLPVDNQLYLSMVEYLDRVDRDNGAFDNDLPPLAAFLGGIEEKVHTVARGETLSEIALAYNVEVGTLISFNGIDDVRRISAGSALKIPSFDGVRYVVRPGDSLSGIALSQGIEVNAILDANNLESALIRPGDLLFLPGASMSDYEYKKATGTLVIYPARGRLTSSFGYRNDPFTGTRRFHYGIDLANTVGTNVTSAMDGVIVDIENRPAGYGKYVVIRHDRGYQTLYGHLSSILVREGQRVRQGQSIGTMGSTGRSTGSHLHFAVYKNNRPVDPLSLLH